MKKEELWKVYDQTYANDYNERYLLNPFSKVSSLTELEVIKSQINNSTKWLDIGCGTGYFLSQFKGVQRAGFDISPEMINLAKEANPDALFFKEGDFRIDNADWHGQWSLISCMWGAYCYVDSVKEVEKVIDNMVKWNEPAGAIFLPVVDLEDVRPNTLVPYEQHIDIFGGKLDLTSVTWSWREAETGIYHEHLVSPHVEHFIKLLQPYYEKIEVVRYPPYMMGWVSRKAILATGKRSEIKPDVLAEVVWQDIPEPAVKTEYDSLMSPYAGIPNKHIILELLHRLRRGIFWRGIVNRIKYRY
jgi:SAM-dependent methyltransferase